MAASESETHEIHHSEDASDGAGSPQLGKKIVVIGIDGSDNSRQAFQWYVDNIHQPSDKCVLVHTVEVTEVLHSTQWYNSPYTFDKNVLIRILEEEKRKIKTKLEGFAQFLKDAKISGSVKSVHAPTPGEGLLKVAKEVDATVIITGTRGLGTVRRTLIGSTSDYVLHHSPVPVVVCRQS